MKPDKPWPENSTGGGRDHASFVRNILRANRYDVNFAHRAGVRAFLAQVRKLRNLFAACSASTLFIIIAQSYIIVESNFRNSGIKTDKYSAHIFSACIKRARRDVSHEWLLHFACHAIFAGNTKVYYFNLQVFAQLAVRTVRGQREETISTSPGVQKYFALNRPLSSRPCLIIQLLNESVTTATMDLSSAFFISF